MENPKAESYLIKIPKKERQIGIDKHKTANQYLKAASENLKAAAKHYEQGNHERSAYLTIVAQGYVNLVNKAQDQEMKHYVLNG